MEKLLEYAQGRIKPDEFGESTIRSLYLDTDDFRLIRNSIDKPVYKEKLRLRSYTKADENTTVFLELKKKFDGVVYKRRERMTYGEAENYFYNKVKPKDTQIMREIDWTMNFYKGLSPKMLVIYDRQAFYGCDDDDLRITFDRNLRYRADELNFTTDAYGESILSQELCVMEIKVLWSMPIWLCNALNELKIYPSSFSKYGTAYTIEQTKSKNTKEERTCA